MPMIDRQEATQTTSNGIKFSTVPTSSLRAASPSSQRFQVVISARSSNNYAPPLPSSEARASNPGKLRRHSFSANIGGAWGVIRTASQCATYLSHPSKDGQNPSLTIQSADDANHGPSHHGASNNATSHGSSQHTHVPKHGSSSHASSARVAHPHTSSKNHASSHPTSSGDIASHGSSHPTSISTDDPTHHASLQPAATLQGNDAGFKKQGGGLSDGDEHTHSGGRRTEPSFSNPPVGSTSRPASQQGKLTSGNRAGTPSKSSRAAPATTKAISKPAETHEKSHAGVPESAVKPTTDEYCKDCRVRISVMESVCFIANDGKISAARTGATYARNKHHHCNVQGCAGNQGYPRPPSPLPKRDSLSKGQALRNTPPTKKKSHTLSGTGDHGRTTSSVQGHDRKKQGIEASVRGSAKTPSSKGSNTLEVKEEPKGGVDTSSLSHTPIDGSGHDVASPSKEHASPHSTTRVPEDQKGYVENTHVENVKVQNSQVALPHISSEMHGGDMGFAHTLEYDIQDSNEFKCILSYHGDTEYTSCSEGGTEATTTPNSISKGAFDDLSNIGVELSSVENELSGPKRSAMARMRQKYMESLTEQEAEKVRLRKQGIMARKQAGDWMLDCHMEEVVHRLAPNGEAHVKVLVEAFETVMHQSDSESSQTAHHQDHEHLENVHS